MYLNRDELIRAKINDLGNESFPDDPDVVWQVRSIVHADSYSFVEAEPDPATVGYPKFMFVLSFATAAEPAVVGCYCFDRGLWSLLFTTPNAPSDWIGLFPAETSSGFEADLLPLLQQGKKIEAIKVYRERSGAGLREAKNAVEALARKHGLAASKASCAGMLLSFLGVLVCLAFLLAGKASPQAEEKPLPGMKLIEWGWDEPDTRFIRQNIERMEQFPFDGLVFHGNSSKGGGLTWELWGSRKFTSDEFNHALDDLRATKFRQFTDRFLRVNVTPGKVDWFDDPAWATVLHNFGVAAQIAKRSRCKGFMFDVEQYDGKLFDYRQQKLKDSKTFAAYQAKVRQRGKEWMQAVNRNDAPPSCRTDPPLPQRQWPLVTNVGQYLA